MSRDAEPTAAALLQPRPWPFELRSAPPLPPGVLDALEPRDPPLLLLLDRREPIDAESRRRLSAGLSADERRRHGAYRRPADQERFLLGRGGLRLLLGAWLELAPEAVPIETGPHGKPQCALGPRFNLSHSGDLLLLALHPLRAVGVDVERLRPGLDWQNLARRLFTQAEQDALERRPAAERPAAFLESWCRLEARLKASGEGLAGLDRLRARDTLATGTAAERNRRMGGLSGHAGPGADVSGAAADPAEPVWNVAVPNGYRAATALAPPGDP